MLDKYLAEQVKKGIKILKWGGVIAFPTDTVYGLGAGIGMPRAVARIYEIKGRPSNMPSALPFPL